ncbi:MAG: hypothetical protein ACLFU1_03350 [Alphaproteobacteria bacterium]
MGNKIIIDPDPKNGSALAIGNHVVLPAHTFSLRYKGEDGAMHDFTVERTLLHEIAHFAFGRNEELTVDIVNAVMEYRFGEEPRYKYGKFNDGLSDNRGTPHYDSAQPASSGYGHQQQYQSAEPRRSVQDFRSGSNEIDQFGRFRMEGFDDSTTRRMVDILQHQNPNFGPEVTIQYTGNGAFGINPHQKLIQINQQILDRPGNLERNLPGALRQLGSPHSSLDMGGGDEIAALDGFDEDAPQIDVHEEGLLHLRQFDLAGDSLYSGDVGLLEETQAFYPAVIAALSPDIVMDSQAPDVTLSSNPGFSGV